MSVRSGAAVVAMEVIALLVALLAFGWPVLVVGVPLLLGTAILFVTLRLSVRPRRWLHARRAGRWEDAPLPGGLMSGFFEIPRQEPSGR